MGIRKTTLKKIFLNVTSVGLAILVTGSVIANENIAAVNSALGVQTYRIVNEQGEDTSSEYVRYYESNYDSIADLRKAGYDKVREIEAEGAVLLKNDNDYLPLKEKTISMFGVTSVNPVYGGTGSGAVSLEEAPSYETAFEDAGFSVNKALLDWYAKSEYGRVVGEGSATSGRPITIGEAPWSAVQEACDSEYGKGETAVFVIGRCGGEGRDLSITDQADGKDGDYLTLNDEEISILNGLKELKDSGRISGIVALINSANPISSAFLKDEQYGIDAAVWIGSVGQTGLYAVADILAGNVNPSGKLPDTFWNDNKENPILSNFGSYLYEGADKYDFGTNPDKFDSYVVYQEGIYLGYKYTETRYEDSVLKTPNVGSYNYQDVVAYPFGYGLSYTQFEYSNFEVKKVGEGKDTVYEATVTVTNTGSKPGKEAVQIYLQKPYTDYDIQNQIEKAAVELVGYGKTKLLEPGAAEKVVVQVPEYYFTSFDTFGTGTYIISEGKHYLTAAENSHTAVNNILAAKGKTTADGMTQEGNSQLTVCEEYQFDAQTYATSMGTGEEVKPLFGFADINRYEGRGDNKVTYISRNDWEGTTHMWEDKDGDGQSDLYEKLVMTDQIAKDVVLDDDDIPADSENAQFPTMNSDKTNLQLIDLRVDEAGNKIAFEDPIWNDYLDQLTYAQLSKLTSIGLRMTVGIEEIGKPETLDHNGPTGITQQYGNGQNGYATQLNDPDKTSTGTCYPCNNILAATFNDQLILEAGELIGEDAMWAGYSGIYGTGVNIHRTPYSGRIFEYYSEDGILSGLIVAAETKGIQSKGVYVYNKHFVLNDQENKRHGKSTWVSEQAFREIYLRAFELPILYADAKCVMTAHSRVGAVWSGASHALMTDWLRGEAGMSGFAVTDMWNKTTEVYMSKPHEILAGTDVPDGFLGRVDSDTKVSDITEDILISELAPYGPGREKESATMAWAMRDSAHRVLYTVVHSRGMDGIASGSKIEKVTPMWQTALDVSKKVFAVLTLAAAILMVMDMIQRRKKEQEA